MTLPRIAETRSGSVHTDREKPSEFNSSGKSRAMFAGDANQEDWPSEGISIERPDGVEEPARQCAASNGLACDECGIVTTHSTGKSTELICCPNCGSADFSHARCTNIAVPDYMTCAAHGGGFKLSPQHRAAMMRGAIKTGASFQQILYCPCNMFKDKCKYKNLYYDEDGVSRCWPEKQTYDAITDYFQTSYHLDEAADLLVLNRMAMAILRIHRNEKCVAEMGEIVERSRSQPDGTVERWFESNAAGTNVDKLDKTLLSWLKGLNVTRAARDVSDHRSTDIAAQLCNPDAKPDDIVYIKGGSDE